MTSISDFINKKRQQTADKKMGMKNPYKFKGGVTTIRILPTWRKDGDKIFYHEFGQAFIKNMNKETLAVIGDRRITFGEDDAIRGLIQRAMGDAATDAQREHYKEMLAKPRILVNALVLDDREVSPTEAQLVDFSETQFDQILEQVQLAGIADEFLDLAAGFNLKVSKTGTKFTTKYTFTFDRKSSSIDPTVLDTLIDIDAYVRSKFADTDRAINALKSISQGTTIEPRAISYSGNADVVEGVFNEASDPAPWEGEDQIERRTEITDEDLDKYFKTEN
jgi:hypothetical protein